MASKQAHKRLMKELSDLEKAPPPYIVARPKETDILEWHYIIRGPPDTPYDGGEYWGTVVFPSDYPFKPPGIKMITPSGRFQPDRKICTSMSDYHPGSWNPAWSVSTILTGLLSFMCSDEITTGSVRSSEADRKVYAKRSHAYNISQARFKALFPEYLDPAGPKDLPNMGDPRLKSKSTSDLASLSSGGPSIPGAPGAGVQNGTAAGAGSGQAVAPAVQRQGGPRNWVKIAGVVVAVWVVLSWLIG